MLIIVFLSITAAVVAVPCLGLLMLIDVGFNSPEDVRTDRRTVSLSKDGQQSGRT